MPTQQGPGGRRTSPAVAAALLVVLLGSALAPAYLLLPGLDPVEAAACALWLGASLALALGALFLLIESRRGRAVLDATMRPLLCVLLGFGSCTGTCVASQVAKDDRTAEPLRDLALVLWTCPSDERCREAIRPLPKPGHVTIHRGEGRFVVQGETGGQWPQIDTVYVYYDSRAKAWTSTQQKPSWPDLRQIYP